MQHAPEADHIAAVSSIAARALSAISSVMVDRSGLRPLLPLPARR
jgi:hypothetical protein